MTTENVQLEQPAGTPPPSEPPTPVAAPEDRWAAIPEKHRAMRDDGSLDLETTLMRVNRQRTELETRFGIGDLRPATAGDYRLAELAEGEAPPAHLAALTDESLERFRQEAHNQGLTNGQFQFMVDKYATSITELAKGLHRYDAAATTAELRAEWTTDADFDRNTQNAVKAIAAYGGDAAQKIIQRNGSDPEFIRLMARVGREMGEAHSPGNTQPAVRGGPEHIRSLIRGEAFSNRAHPDHKSVSQQVRAYFESGGTVPPIEDYP